MTHLARREFLLALAAASLQAQAPSIASRQYRIDIHHHFFPPEYVAAIGNLAAAFPPWSTAQSLEVMGKANVERSLLSLSLPGVWLGTGNQQDIQQGRRLARIVNDYGAQMGRDHPTRFGLFATLPMPDAEGSLREIEYAYGTLKAEGIGLMTSYNDKWLGDAAFAPVWEELHRRRAVVYTHPLSPSCCGALNYGLGPGAIEWATDTTRTAASLLFSGTAAKYPNIRWILSHGGGTLPFLLSRLVREESTGKNMNQRLPRGLMYEIRKFYYDTAQANTAGPLAALLEMVPSSQLLYGSDYPYRTFDELNAGLGAFRGFTSTDLRAIERDNALQLLS
jgi:predicted TIM-barrel fold metal-dependent hydrolase